MSLIVKSFSDEYELVRAGASPLSSCSEFYALRDHTYARQFISYIDVSPESWRSLLMRLGVSITPNFNHANDIYDALARSCVHGGFSFYKLIKIEKLKAIPCGKGMGIAFVKGPKPHSNTNANLVDIDSAKDATDLIASLTAKDDDLIRYVSSMGLVSKLSSVRDIKKVITDKLAAKEILAYKIPVYSNAPPKKQGELIPATGPGYDKVPLAPESKNSGAKVESNNNISVDSTIPNDTDIKLAKSEGATPAQIRSRERVSRHYLETNGYTESQISDALGSSDGTRIGGVDLTKSVSVIKFPPPEHMSQYVNSHGYPGNWFDPIGNQSPDALGISGEGRTLAKFTMPQGSGLQTHSKPILDTWTTIDKPIQTNGGGVQLFVNDNVKKLTISLNNIG